jgi:hypothetical protein
MLDVSHDYKERDYRNPPFLMFVLPKITKVESLIDMLFLLFADPGSVKLDYNAFVHANQTVIVEIGSGNNKVKAFVNLFRIVSHKSSHLFPLGAAHYPVPDLICGRE